MIQAGLSKKGIALQQRQLLDGIVYFAKLYQIKELETELRKNTISKYRTKGGNSPLPKPADCFTVWTVDPLALRGNSKHHNQS